MKKLVFLALAGLLLTACSSAPTQTVNSKDGYSVELPSAWNVIEADDTQKASLRALAPEADDYQAGLMVNVSRSFSKQPKNETISQLKQRLDGYSTLQQPATLLSVCGEPAITCAWQEQAPSPANPILTVDVATFCCFICDDDQLYTLTFSCLASQAPEFRSEIFEKAVASFKPISYYKKAEELEELKRQNEAAQEKALAAEAAAKETEAAQLKAQEEAYEATGEAVTKMQEISEKGEEAKERFAASEEEVKAEAKSRFQEKADKVKAAALSKVEEAKIEAEKAQIAAVESAKAAKEAAKEARERALALSKAQEALDALSGEAAALETEIPAANLEDSVEVKETDVEVKEAAVEVAPVQIETPADASVAPAVPKAEKKSGPFFIEMETVKEGK